MELKTYYANMEPNRVNKPYMIEPVVLHNSDGPNGYGSSFHSLQDEDDFNRINMDRNWERGSVLYLYYTLNLSIKCYFIDF